MGTFFSTGSGDHAPIGPGRLIEAVALVVASALHGGITALAWSDPWILSLTLLLPVVWTAYGVAACHNNFTAPNQNQWTTEKSSSVDPSWPKTWRN